MTRPSAGHFVRGFYDTTVQREKTLPSGEKRLQTRLVIAGDTSGWDDDGNIRVSIPHGQVAPQLEKGEFYSIPVTLFTPNNSERVFCTFDSSRAIGKESVPSQNSEAA